MSTGADVHSHPIVPPRRTDTACAGGSGCLGTGLTSQLAEGNGLFLILVRLVLLVSRACCRLFACWFCWAAAVPLRLLSFWRAPRPWELPGFFSVFFSAFFFGRHHSHQLAFRELVGQSHAFQARILVLSIGSLALPSCPEPYSAGSSAFIFSSFLVAVLSCRCCPGRSRTFRADINVASRSDRRAHA